MLRLLLGDDNGFLGATTRESAWRGEERTIQVAGDGTEEDR